MKRIKPDCDVLVIGSGASGLISSVLLAKAGLKVINASERPITDSSSSLAQGGIAVPLLQEDSVSAHIQDTLKVGGELCDPKIVELYIKSIKPCIEELEKWGVLFYGYSKGKIEKEKLAREGAHSHRRVLKIGSDNLSGRRLMKNICDIAIEEQKLSFFQGASLVKLLKDSENLRERCTGAVFLDPSENLVKIFSKAVILATGGYSAIFSRATNSFGSVGEGIICANKLGAKLRDMHIVQFHPTALNAEGYFLLSETLRGEGAILINAKKERFMSKYDPERMELAQRSVVSRAVWQEEKETGAVFLDLSPIPKEKILSNFFGIYEKCLELGFDLTKEPVPVTPAAHYSIGGVEVNENCETSVEGLWAVGECANTRFHGKDRLASNSLLECIVSAFLASDSVKEKINHKTEYFEILELEELKDKEIITGNYSDEEIRLALNKLKQMAWKHLAFTSNSSHSEFKEFLDMTEKKFALNSQEFFKKISLNRLKNAVALSEIILKINK